MQQRLNFDDVTAKRHGGNEASAEANKRAQWAKGYWRGRVILFAAERGAFTLKEICEAFDRPLNALSGRISELKRDGLLVDTGERRNGCAVLRLSGVAR